MTKFSSSITVITDASAFSLSDLNLSNPIVQNGVDKYVVMFKQEWCHYCQQYIETYNKFANLMPKIQFLYVEGTTSPDIMTGLNNVIFPKYEIKGYPTLIIYNSDGTFYKEVKDRYKLDAELN